MKTKLFSEVDPGRMPWLDDGMSNSFFKSIFLLQKWLNKLSSELREAYIEYLKFVSSAMSQEAACDGNYYQISPGRDDTSPPPGVLPI